MRPFALKLGYVRTDCNGLCGFDSYDYFYDATGNQTVVTISGDESDDSEDDDLYDDFKDDVLACFAVVEDSCSNEEFDDCAEELAEECVDEFDGVADDICDEEDEDTCEADRLLSCTDSCINSAGDSDEFFVCVDECDESDGESQDEDYVPDLSEEEWYEECIEDEFDECYDDEYDSCMDEYEDQFGSIMAQLYTGFCASESAATCEDNCEEFAEDAVNEESDQEEE
jgi:hypothetical protein